MELPWLARLRELTDENYHVLALWFIAKQFEFTDLKAELADMVCEHTEAGEVSDDLNARYLEKSKHLIQRITLVHGMEIAQQVRACL